MSENSRAIVHSAGSLLAAVRRRGVQDRLRRRATPTPAPLSGGRVSWISYIGLAAIGRCEGKTGRL